MPLAVPTWAATQQGLVLGRLGPVPSGKAQVRTPQWGLTGWGAGTGEGVQQPGLSPCRVLKAGPLREMGRIQSPTLAAVSGRYSLDPGLSVVGEGEWSFPSLSGPPVTGRSLFKWLLPRLQWPPLCPSVRKHLLRPLHLQQQCVQPSPVSREDVSIKPASVEAGEAGCPLEPGLDNTGPIQLWALSPNRGAGLAGRRQG